MRQFLASTVEQRKTFETDFQTHPMEAGWASEAIFFLVVEDIRGVSLEAQVEISVDGVTWVPEGTRFEKIGEPGTYFVKARHFGNWLRVSAKMAGTGAAKVSVHLHLKE